MLVGSIIASMMYVLLKSWYQNKKQEWYVTEYKRWWYCYVWLVVYANFSEEISNKDVKC